MKTDFDARPVFLAREDRIKAHFLTCFLALLHFMLLKRSLKGTYTTEKLLDVLKGIKFADVEEQGFMPVYERQELTDKLYEACGFRTDYKSISKRKMKEIQKKVRTDKTLLYFMFESRSATAPVFSGGCGTYMFPHVSKTGLYRKSRKKRIPPRTATVILTKWECEKRTASAGYSP